MGPSTLPFQNELAAKVHHLTKDGLWMPATLDDKVAVSLMVNPQTMDRLYPYPLFWVCRNEAPMIRLMDLIYPVAARPRVKQVFVASPKALAHNFEAAFNIGAPVVMIDGFPFPTRGLVTFLRQGKTAGLLASTVAQV